MAAPSRTNGTKRWFWLGLLSSWFGLSFFLFILPGFLTWTGSLAILINRKSTLKWNLVAFSSWVMIPLLCFSFATKDYFMGTARLKSVGLLNEAFYNLDPEYRVWNQTSGCMILGHEMITHPANNIAVKFWTSLLGFQKNVYTGFYPDRETAKALLAKSENSLHMRKLENELEFQLKGKAFRTDRAWYGLWLEDFEEIEARYVLIDEELLIVYPLSQRNIKTTFLFDYKRGTKIAAYFAR